MKHLLSILVLNVAFFSAVIKGFSQNLALNKPVKVSSVETGTSYSGNLAVDGNYKSRWSSDHSDPQWIYVDLGGQYNITSVKITWENAYGKNYNIDISNDATNWTTIKSITDNSSLTNNNSVPYSEISKNIRQQWHYLWLLIYNWKSMDHLVQPNDQVAVVTVPITLIA